MATNEALAKRLAAVKVSTLVANQKLIELSTKVSVSHAFKILLEGGILSAPVRDVDGKFVGIVDCVDLLEQVVKVYPETAFAAIDTYQLFGEDNAYSLKLSSTQLVELGKRNAFIPLSPDASVLDCIKHMVSNGTRRTPLVNDQGEMCGYVTLSNLIRFVIQTAVPEVDPSFSAICTGNIPLLNETAQYGANHTVESIDESSPAIEAFCKMSKYKLSALPIVDKSGALVGCISASDIRHVGKSAAAFRKLYGGVIDYISPIRKEHTRAVHPAISVKESDRLGLIMGKLAAVGTHRVFVVNNESRKLEGVVALSDIACALSTLQC